MFPRNFDEMMDRRRPGARALAAVPRHARGARTRGGQPAVCRGRPASARFRRVLPGLRRPGGRGAALAAQPCAAADRCRPNGQELKAGLIQRAELLEAILADIYGPANLVREGRLPAAVDRRQSGIPAAARRRRRRPAVRICGSMRVDVGRSPDGRWWVLGDRTQAPSGAGYALENRLALSRAMPDIYRAASGRARSRRSSRPCRPSCRRSAAATIRRSAC